MSNFNFEEALVQLEKAVDTLENEQLSLDDSLKIFEEGIHLYRLCNKELGRVEKKISKIVEAEGELQEVSFEYDGED